MCIVLELHPTVFSLLPFSSSPVRYLFLIVRIMGWSNDHEVRKMDDEDPLLFLGTPKQKESMKLPNVL